MPAIQIDRLKSQIQSILEPKFPPEIFLESLRSLMEAHANLAFRTTSESFQKQGLESYQLSPLIINQLQLFFIQFAKANPDIALSYVDIIWSEPVLEMKQMAGIFMSALPVTKIPDILERVIKWSGDTKDKTLRMIIFNESTKTIRDHGLNKWLDIISGWVNSGNPQMIIPAIQAIQVLILDPKFENIPYVFNKISSISSFHNEKITNELSELIQLLILREPIETQFFVKSMLLSQPSPELFRIIRRNLGYFSDEQQEKIRQIMKS
ncbi:MAG: hypothetical protein CVU46_01720 [Chloroflexi bacterium HGW-Chloroflexi-8]|nr:MAG: hypothetical protein CVU46_01720 [Chloroflexi bacterium HGW-Chloroflexi-8]